ALHRLEMTLELPRDRLQRLALRCPEVFALERKAHVELTADEQPLARIVDVARHRDVEAEEHVTRRDGPGARLDGASLALRVRRRVLPGQVSGHRSAPPARARLRNRRPASIRPRPPSRPESQAPPSRARREAMG